MLAAMDKVMFCACCRKKPNHTTKQHKFKNDWAREGGGRGGGGRGRGIMKCGGRGGRGAMGRGGRGVGGVRNTFGWICFNCDKHGHKQDNCPDKQEKIVKDDDAV